MFSTQLTMNGSFPHSPQTSVNYTAILISIVIVIYTRRVGAGGGVILIKHKIDEGNL